MFWQALVKSAVYVDPDDQIDPEFKIKSRVLVYTNHLDSENFQLRVIETTFNNYARTTEARVLVACPLHLDRMTMRHLAPPRPSNGRVETISINQLNRENLLEFILS